MDTAVYLCLDTSCSSELYSPNQHQIRREPWRAGQWVLGPLPLGSKGPNFLFVGDLGMPAVAFHWQSVNSMCVLASCLALGPLPPPPPISRNGSTSRALPSTPQLPSRAGLDSQRGGPRPPLPPDRPGSAAPPPPPPSAAVRNGFQDPADGEPPSQLFALHTQGVVAFGPNTSEKVWDRDFVSTANL